MQAVEAQSVWRLLPPAPENAANLSLMHLIDAQFLETPYCGSWQTTRHLQRLSNTMEAEFCIDALQDALARYGPPEIFNTDQGSQFTSPWFR